jgi:tetratricopeptide (TPR) repeat protein
VRRRGATLPRLLAPLAILALSGCIYGTARPNNDKVSPTLLRTSQAPSIDVIDTLEALVAAGRETTADREWAYFEISHRPPPATAADAFARAAAAGRIAQLRGLNAGALIKEVEHYGRLSNQLDPTFRDGAARRMLATLYVMAPASMVRNGDSETGLELLEALIAEYPGDVENHLRLGEAYVSLGDYDSAAPELCASQRGAAHLRRDDRQLLELLMQEARVSACPEGDGAP